VKTLYGALRYPVALCCFDNADAAEAKPLTIWYRPADHDRLVLPAIDSHTWAVPELGTDVMTDHWLLFGSDDAGDDWGEPVAYDRQPRRTLLDFLPPRVAGLQVPSRCPTATSPLPTTTCCTAGSTASSASSRQEHATGLRPGDRRSAPSPRPGSSEAGLTVPPAPRALVMPGSPRFDQHGISLARRSGHDLVRSSAGSLQLRVRRQALGARRRRVEPGTRDGDDVFRDALDVGLR
jgi:hypothetical protein